MAKFGRAIRVSLFIKLVPYDGYYLAMLGADEGMRWALLNVTDGTARGRNARVIDDYGWLDVDRIGGGNERQRRWLEVANRVINGANAEVSDETPLAPTSG